MTAVVRAFWHGDNPHDVRDALPAALADCGTAMPDSDAAAAAVVFVQLARMHLDGQAGALWVAQKAEEVLTRAGFSDNVLALPLGGLCDIADEWGGGWGRTGEQLAAVVRETCEEQLRSGSVTAEPKRPARSAWIGPSLGYEPYDVRLSRLGPSLVVRLTSAGLHRGVVSGVPRLPVPACLAVSRAQSGA